MRKITRFTLLVTALLLVATPAYAYVGPGAGFAFITSFFFLIATFFVALFSVMIWPIRFLFIWLRRRRALKNAKVNRVVVLGLDGMDPDLTEKWMAEGHLPNFKALSEKGSFSRLQTTYPAVSPVAWSSFMTGANPGRHRIYDFLSRDKNTYLPTLSSAYIGNAKKTIKLGKYRIPVGKPDIRLLRKSKPFWVVLSDHGVRSSILRVPITFPPDKFKGVQLSGMCVPDLLGSQGTFSFFTTRAIDMGDDAEGGVVLPLTKSGKEYLGEIKGPPNSLVEGSPDMILPFKLSKGKNGACKLTLPDKTYWLEVGKFSGWLPVKFKAGLGIKVSGIAHFLVTEFGDEVSLYVTPINLDPERPAFPITNPPAYSMYLAKQIGPYANLGLAEDTWVLNEGLLTDDQFLKECELIHEEREQMFFDALEKTRSGVVVCVFDDTDRIQHMFFRYLEKDHPALSHYPESDRKDAILDLYKKTDVMLGRVMNQIKKDDAFFVMSDHGFKPFVRGVNLNTWLHQNGYLALKPDSKKGKWLSNVNWENTRAYQVGLGGFYLNLKGREAKGIVEPGAEAEALIRELIEKLTNLPDEERSEIGINDVWAATDIYKGPYVGEAPDLIIGYNVGYRAGWDGVTGVITDKVFDDNVKAWSGDHCMDPRKVPGVLFSTSKITKDSPSIMDIAPTVLGQLGVKKPGYMDGESLMEQGSKEAVS